MKECPNCRKKTIPNKWVFFNKSENVKKFCIECSNCHKKIQKQKSFPLAILSSSLVEGTLLLIATVLLDMYLNSLFDSFFALVILFTIIHFSIEYYAPLSIADEDYCVGGVTKIDAILTIIVILVIVCITIYTLVVQPFILNEVPFN